MGGSHYYLLTSLPALGEPGSRPPLSKDDLAGMVREVHPADEIVGAILLGDDLLQRQAVEAGEMTPDQTDPGVLTPAQVRGEQPLPEILVPAEPRQPPAVPSDLVWAAYYLHAERITERTGSRFLGAWIAHEVGLRNALVVARAKALDLDPSPYLVLPELGDRDADFDAIVAEWTAAESPLAGLKALDRARWRWLVEHDAWFSFSDDEIACYAARLLILHRWHRLAGGDEAARADTTQGQTGRRTARA